MIMSDFFDYQDFVPTVATKGSGGRFRLGVVQTVASDHTITATVAGSTTILTGIRYLGHVQPVPDQPIWLITDGLDLFAFGVQADSGSTFSPRASRSTTQSIADGTETAITFDAVNSDPWGAWSSGSATRLTARLTGRYIAVGQVHFAGNANGYRAVWIEKTATTTVGRSQWPTVGAGSPTWMNVTTTPFDMTAGTDYIRLMVLQNSGGALNVNTSSTISPALSLIYLGP